MREKIPSEIKREVRQRCGFGCVICGLPIYEYDHMIEYSKVQSHDSANLTLLCSNHHLEKTKRLLTYQQVFEANSKPFNILNKVSSPYKLNISGDNFDFRMGDCQISISNLNPQNDFVIPFLVDNLKLISFDITNGQLFFNLVIFNSNEEVLLKIEDNELLQNSMQWDIEFIGRRLKLREGIRGIILDVEFIIPNGVIIHSGIFEYRGYKLEIKDGRLESSGISLQVKKFENFRILFAAGEYDNRFSTLARLPKRKAK